MKILFLTRRFWPEIGGVERHVFEVSKRLVKMGHEVTVVSEDDGSFSRLTVSSTSGEYFAHPRGVFTAYRIPIGKSEKLKKFLIWGWLWKHRDLIKDADIVHAHDVGFWYWPARLLFPNKPFFMTFHGWEEKFPVPLRNKIQRKISEKMAKGNLCVGKYLEKWYGTKADDITYGGINVPPRSHGFSTESADQPATVRGETTGDDLGLLFIGRLEKEAGINMYLKALKLLKEEGKNFNLTICGDGSLRKEAEKYGKVLGFIENIEPYLQKADFVFSSGYLSILEAMAERKLVFSVFDNPLKEDYLKLGPLGKLIIICGNEKELAEKLKYYSQNQKQADKLVEEAYNWAEGQTWKKVAEMYLKLYES